RYRLFPRIEQWLPVGRLAGEADLRLVDHDPRSPARGPDAADRHRPVHVVERPRLHHEQRHRRERLVPDLRAPARAPEPADDSAAVGRLVESDQLALEQHDMLALDRHTHRVRGATRSLAVLAIAIVHTERRSGDAVADGPALATALDGKGRQFHDMGPFWLR